MFLVTYLLPPGTRLLGTPKLCTRITPPFRGIPHSHSCRLVDPLGTIDPRHFFPATPNHFGAVGPQSGPSYKGPVAKLGRRGSAIGACYCEVELCVCWGFRVSNATFNAIVMRYSDKDGHVKFNDFVAAYIKLKTLFGKISVGAFDRSLKYITGM